MIGLFLGSFAVPIILIVFGWLFTHGRYPKHPNGIYGYRTTRSMKNDEVWKFAQECWGRQSWRMGWVLFVLSLIMITVVYSLSSRKYDVYIGIWVPVQAILTLVTIIPVERALKDNFDEFGHRKKI